MAGRDKAVRESKVENYHIIRPSDLNSVGRLYGGTLMSWIDEVAVLVGKRHSEMGVTTGSMDNLKFLKGAYLQDMLILKGKVTHVGNTSMEIKVETFVEHSAGEQELINRAYLTLIGLDENDKPARLPRLILETEEDHQEWERANARREIRKKQSKEGFSFYGD